MHQLATPRIREADLSGPICVDLDGSLVKSDTLVDSLLVLARQRPAGLFGAVAPLLRGKAAFKAWVAGHVSLDVAHLPYNRRLVEYLREEHQRGRPIYLATGADQALARRVAAELGIFTGVFASDGTTNLTGIRKLRQLRTHLDRNDFVYIGNDRKDLPLLAGATEPMVANPSLRLRFEMGRRGLRPTRVFEDRKPALPAIAKALRPHQWAKNALVFLPFLLSHGTGVGFFFDGLVAFFCLCATASACYVFNDLLDIETDRRHPRKQRRPFASGDLPPVAGFLLGAGLLALGFAGSRFLPLRFTLWLAVYLVFALAYSLYLKRLALVDVFVLSGLYTVRIEIGGAATKTPISHWLAGFSIFLFLALAIVKRFAELENLRARGAVPHNGRGYLLADLEQLRALGTASSYAAVIIFAIYINSRDVAVLYHRPNVLWLIVPLQIYWLSRVWLLASRGELNEDPVVFALTDKESLLVGLAVAAVAFWAL